MKKINAKKFLISTLTGASILCAGTSVALLNNGAVEADATETGNKVEVYQLAPSAEYLMESYVIKTANGKLIVIDGGIGGVYDDDGTEFDGNSALAADAYLPAALRAIAGKAEGEQVVVDAWFLSHAHRDHYAELGKILSDSNAGGLTINGLYFDFPDFGGSYPLTNTQQTDLENLKTAFATCGFDYDALNGLIINAESVERGLTITVDGVHFDVLQTWSYASGAYDDVNDTSLVIRMRSNDNSILFLNDCGVEAGERLVSTYTADELKSDYVQMAHHGHAGLTKAQYDYFITDETQLLWPTPSVTFSDSTTFFVDETYEWFNGTSYLVNGTPDDSKIDKERNFFACLYDAYPTDMTSVDDWADVIDGMKVASFDYVDLSFEMLGAAVRTAEMDGIRFIAQISSDARTQYGEIAKYGVMMIPADMDTAADLTLTYDGTNYTTSNSYALVVEAKDWWTEELCQQNGIADGYSAFSGALVAAQSGDVVTKFPTEFYNRPITAVGFIIAEDGTVVYTEKMTRSIAYVASVESLKPAYEANETIENIKAGATLSLSVNSGATLTNLMKAYAPTLTVGGMDVYTFSAVTVTYSSDNEAAAKVVGGKIQPVANGSATITATVTIDGNTTITATTDVNVEVTKDVEWVTLNDATTNFAAYGDGTTTSEVTTSPDDTATGCVKVTSNSEWGWFYLPFTEDGVVQTTRALQLKYSTFKFNVYVPDTLQGNVAIPAKEILAAGTTAGWYEIEITADELSTDSVNGVPTYNDVAGLFVQFRSSGDVIYVDDVLGLTLAPNYTPEQLATPEVEIWNDGTAVWGAVEGATAYAYATDGLNFTVTNDTSVKLSGKQVVRVKALGDGAYYKDSAMSEEVVYVQKDMLNACEYVSGYVEMYGTGATIATTADYSTQGWFGYKMTTGTDNGWAAPVIYLRKDGSPLTLEQLSEYDYISIDVHVEDQAINFWFYNHNLGKIEAGTTTTIQLTPAIIEEQIAVNASAYNEANGSAIFQLQSYSEDVANAPSVVYIDNIVGVYKEQQITTDGTTTTVLNDCESVGGWVQAVNTPTLSTENVFEGTYSIEVIFGGWSWFNVRLFETAISLEELQATYDTITFNVYSSIDGLNIFRADQATVAGLLSAGDNVITLNTANLTSTDFNGEFLTFWAGGASTIRIDNVVGTKEGTSTTLVNFGNAYILGDSYSTYKNWTPDRYIYDANGNVVGIDGNYYSDYSSIVNSVEDTWWHKLLTTTGSNLVKNDSWGGTTICYTGYSMSTEIDQINCQNMSFLQRFVNTVISGYFDDKDIDTVFIFGGTNDAWVNGPLVEAGGDSILGEPMYSGWTDEDLLKVYPALCCLINMVKTYLPDAKIVVLGNDYGHDYYSASSEMTEKFAEIVEFYQTNGFDIDYIPVSLEASDLSSLHPTVGGMQKISDQIIAYYNS